MRIDAPTAADLSDLRRLWTAVFGDEDAFLDIFFNTAFAQNRCRCLWDDETLCASLYWFDVSCAGQKLAYLYAIGTAPSHRNQGLCRTLVEDTKTHLKSQGYAGAILVPAGQKLFDMYGKMGFEVCTQVSEYEICAQQAPCQLKRLSPDAYAKLRREFLPEGAVLQEGENLAFLQTQASFFQGTDCLLAASKEDEALHCHEFLGNIQSAPGILTALGCKAGFFRTVGSSKDFSMYCPLIDTCPRPSYFGFAFD